jgi:hypothetical protein|tara:strand:+ start:416 stop:700 length:285 start_codon:yes stop_codon:yes gene_type:complete
MIKITITTFLFLLSAVTVAAPHVHPVQTNINEQEIIDIISGIKYGWENGDGAPFRETFLDFEGAHRTFHHAGCGQVRCMPGLTSMPLLDEISLF